VILWMIAASGVSAAQVEGDAAVRAAIASSVQARVGAAASVTIDLQIAEVAPGAALESADPEPGARFGRPARFRLRAAGRTIGYAVGIIHVTMPHLRLTRAVAAGAALTIEDVKEVMGDPGPLPIESLPARDAVVGITSSRALIANEVVTMRTVRVALAVRSGDVVTTRVVVDGVEAVGVATALQSGSVGDIIRLVNADSRRQLRGRITGKAAVEVQHES
jgi:flagella basal body P-ring formation protein FlgA